GFYELRARFVEWAEACERFGLRVGARVARCHERVDASRHVKAQLRVGLRFGGSWPVSGVSSEQALHTIAVIPPRAHRAGSGSVSSAVTAAVYRSHVAVSARNDARPLAVS